MQLTMFILSLLAVLAIGIASGYFAPLLDYAWYWKVGGTMVVFGGAMFVLCKIINKTVYGMDALVLMMMVFGIGISLALGWLIGRLLR